MWPWFNCKHERDGFGKYWNFEGTLWGQRKEREPISEQGGGLNLQATKRNGIPPDITHWATSRQIKHSGVGCLVWQSVTVAGSSEEQELKTGVLSFTRNKGWAQSDPISFPLLQDLTTIEHIYLFYLASTFQRTVIKCFTKEEMNTINNNSNKSKKLCKHSKECQKKTIWDQE